MAMTQNQLDDLSKALARDGAASVIESMLGDAVNHATKAEDRVTFVMRLLEEMAGQRVETACCLMLSLWPVASALMMHETCDAIDLWISHNRSAAVVEQLRHALASEVEPDLKRHYAELLQI